MSAGWDGGMRGKNRVTGKNLRRGMQQAKDGTFRKI